jgi:hypothetical protein
MKQVVAETDYAGWATLVIWDHFKIPDGATFDLIGRVRLIFKSATVDGTLKADEKDSILGTGGEEKPAITGEGNVWTSKDAEAKTPTELKEAIKVSEAHTPQAADDDDDYNIDEDNGTDATDENGDGGETDTNGLAAIEFQSTATNSSGDGYSILDSETGIGEASASWTLKTVEKAYVYFAVTKTADHAITASGTDADNVSVATNGGEIDGSQPGDTLAVVTVDARDFDTQFEGGEYNFTLTVTKGQETVKTINVTLQSGVDTDTYGVTIFKVTYDGGNEKLEKQDARIGAQTHYKAATDKNTWQNNPQPVDSLYDANRWLEHSAVSGTEGEPAEWLVRLNKDQNETMPVYIALKDRNYVTVRLQGAGEAAKIITPVEGLKDINAYNDYSKAVFNNSHYSGNSSGLINVGVKGGDTHLTLKLKNITVDGKKGYDGQYFVTSNGGCPIISLVGLIGKATIDMESGSKITGFKGRGGVGAPVYVNTNGCTFLMREGSAITGNEFSDKLSSTTKFGWIQANGRAKANFTFKRPSGVETIYDNTAVTTSATYLKKVHCTSSTGGGESYDSYFD